MRLLKQVKNTTPGRFRNALEGKRIAATGRRGKFLIFHLEDKSALVVHLGMSGQVTYWDHAKDNDKSFAVDPVTGLQRSRSQHAPDKHTHALWHLDKGDRIQYRDPRQFGKLFYFEPGEMEGFKPLARLGMEPLDAAFRWPAFHKAMAPKRGMLKPLLLSQHPVAGLGNIYVDEALWLSRLHPRRRAESLDPNHWKALFRAIPKVLKQGLKHRGTTLMDFRNADGTHGGNQELLKAYGRAEEPCLRCRKSLKRIVVSQRATVYCPSCQRPPARLK